MSDTAYGRGERAGYDRGSDEAYDEGYLEGHEDGYKEAMARAKDLLFEAWEKLI